MVRLTKNRYAVLVGDIGLRCLELLQEIVCSQEMTIYISTTMISGCCNRAVGSIKSGFKPEPEAIG
ncbi:MAG: hypothetical protein HOO87_14370 [Methyloglobulus sp.]|nr:hypothetical protein [Methyloglobulus sp.]